MPLKFTSSVVTGNENRLFYSWFETEISAPFDFSHSKGRLFILAQ